MYTITARNVNEAFHRGTYLFRKCPDFVRKISPRGKETLEVIMPVCTVYTNPMEKVLFCRDRDANPFFHFFESLWILAGRKDVEYVKQFNSNIHVYSDNGVDFHGAYGWRLRKEGGQDQIEEVIDLLKTDPDTRRAVLQIWRAEKDLNIKSSDVPCNDLIFLKIRDNRLNMTVCCRSNDVIWGAYGANVVQFGTLMEYLAGRIGCEVGEYRQISDSFHIYLDNPFVKTLLTGDVLSMFTDFYDIGEVTYYPLVKDPETFDQDLLFFMSNPDAGHIGNNTFFRCVARPMWYVWNRHKEAKDGLKYVDLIQASDWKLAVQWWLERREEV